MKTNIIISTVIAVIFFSFNMLAAQNQFDLATTTASNQSFNYASTPSMPVDVKPNYRKEMLSIDQQNGVLSLNYELSGFTQSATFQIQDFTGRTLKSFKVKTMDASVNQFEINDLLAGTYKYVLIVDLEKKTSGEFEWND
jgi:hypothetical protein